MSKQNQPTKTSHTKTFIIAGAVVILMMAAALCFLRWTLNADPVNAPPAFLTAVILIIPVIVTFALFIVLVQRIWKIPKNDTADPEKEQGGDE